MVSIVINIKHGGFGLSDEAILEYAKKVNLKLIKIGRSYYIDGVEESSHYFSSKFIARQDPYLVEVVRELGERANTKFSNLKIVEIPNDVDWEIMEYDGAEHVAEKHRTWY